MNVWLPMRLPIDAMIRLAGPGAVGAVVLMNVTGCGAHRSEAVHRAGGPHAVDVATIGNPFAGATMFLNPDYAEEVQRSMDASPADAPALQKMKSMPTAIWLDRIAMIPRIAPFLDAALAQQVREHTPVVTVFVLYDLPDRDCHANASHGELHAATGGLHTYETDYVDAIAAVFEAHPDQRIVVIVEPDSIPNIATNLDDPRCAAAEQAYREGTAYAIRTLAAPNVFLYLDTGHSGWLGWTDNQRKTAKVFKQVLDAAGGAGLIRGFAANVANYSVLRETTEQFDYQGNPAHDELTFQAQLSATYRAEGIPNVAWVIDTGRNGVGGIRHDWGYWCNTRGAGLGERPTAAPAPGVDAYLWVKPPGESDGTSDPTAAGYDPDCGKEDAATEAPGAGLWFHPYFLDVVRNANPPL
jgi:cellulose 1,4-beta-cellobiosidase